MGAAAVVEKGRGGTAVEVGEWEPAPPHRARKACGPTRQANDSPVNFFMGLSLTIKAHLRPNTCWNSGRTNTQTHEEQRERREVEDE
jgi:hypothetical protein